MIAIALLPEWACGAAGSALPWHGRGRRFDPDQVHQISYSDYDTQKCGFAGTDRNRPDNGSSSVDVRLQCRRCPAGSASCGNPVLVVHLWRLLASASLYSFTCSIK